MDPVIIGTIQRAHGVHGMVRTRATGPTLATLVPGDEVRVTSTDGTTRVLTVLARSGEGDHLLFALSGIASREDAEALRGARLSVDAERLPPAEPDEFYVRDLIGAAVWVGEVPLGEVRDIINRPANDVLEVAGPHGEMRLLPFSRDAVRAIDPAARRIELREGLIDLPGGDDG
jgi:16S rRNA processing protein RimM